MYDHCLTNFNEEMMMVAQVECGRQAATELRDWNEIDPADQDLIAERMLARLDRLEVPSLRAPRIDMGIRAVEQPAPANPDDLVEHDERFDGCF